MEKEFKILSLSEERKLSSEELKQYYIELREYLKTRKLTNTTPGATTIAPKLKGVTNGIVKELVKILTNKDIEWICDGQENIPDGACLFAHTHQGLLDNILWVPLIDKHCILLHGAKVSKLLLCAQYNTGLVLVKKDDKQNNQNAKLDMIKLLREGHSITYFPEGIWNLSPNKLHLPLSFGFLDTARKAEVPVVPVVHEFTYDTTTDTETIVKIHSKFGKPIYITENDDLLKKLEEYKEVISTMRYELIEEKGINSRSEISNTDYINYLKGSYKILKTGKLDRDFEMAHIFGANDEFHKFFHINDVPFDNDGNLLETEEVQKLKRINKEHGI